MAQATKISMRHGFCDSQCLERICKLIEKTGLPTDLPKSVKNESLVQGMEVDKKSAGGKIKFVVCAGIGSSRFHSFSAPEVLTALED
jgi:3-dehydroquinate synthetase